MSLAFGKHKDALGSLVAALQETFLDTQVAIVAILVVVVVVVVVATKRSKHSRPIPRPMPQQRKRQVNRDERET